MSNLATAYLERLKVELAVSSDEELAERIGVAKSTLATWRTRGIVPATSLSSIQSRTGVQYSEVQRDFLNDVARRSHVTEVALFLSVLKLGRELPPDQHQDWASWLAANKSAILDELFHGLEDVQDPDERAVRMLVELSVGKRLNLKEFQKLRELKEVKGPSSSSSISSSIGPSSKLTGC